MIKPPHHVALRVLGALSLLASSLAGAIFTPAAPSGDGQLFKRADDLRVGREYFSIVWNRGSHLHQKP